MRVSVRKTLFAISSAALLPFAWHCVRGIPALVARRQELRPDYPYPQWSDLYILGVAVLFFVPMRYLLTRTVFYHLAHWILPGVAEKREWTTKIREDRVERWATVCFKFLYFVGITAFGMHLLKPTEWFPPELGGSGSTDRMFDEFPYDSVTPFMKEYYLIGVAYHTQSLVFHVVGPHRNDFAEMVLHHLCAIFLALFSYFCNFHRIGSLVLFVHDAADVAGYAVKASVDTKYTKMTLVIYACLLFVWAYTRFYVFPFLIIAKIGPGLEYVQAKWADSHPELVVPYNWKFFEGMLYILLVLHVYWYALFLYMGYMYSRTGVTKDLQQKAVGEKYPCSQDAKNNKIGNKLSSNSSNNSMGQKKKQQPNKSGNADRLRQRHHINGTTNDNTQSK